MNARLQPRGNPWLTWPWAAWVLVALALPLHAQSYDVNWHVISGSGGTSTGGVFTISGTIGQPAAGGPMVGGQYSLTGGFWALYAVQSPGAPQLRIFLTRTNTAVVAWPAPSTGFLLQQSATMATGSWATNSTIPIVVNGENQVIVSPPVGRLFYRLKQ